MDGRVGNASVFQAAMEYAIKEEEESDYLGQIADPPSLEGSGTPRRVDRVIVPVLFPVQRSCFKMASGCAACTKLCCSAYMHDILNSVFL